MEGTVPTGCDWTPEPAHRAEIGGHNQLVPSGALSSIAVRRARVEDDDAVLGLLQASMGWVPDDEHLAFFRWKHRENPQGESPAWVALDGARVVGYRTFLRWPFDHGDQRISAVRAVDTATHPDYQGRGIFTQLTRQALAELDDEGVDFVFNTPNDRSLPGYLKLGWQALGRLPASFRPRSARSLAKLAGARRPAGKWSVPTTAGEPAAEALCKRAVEALIDGLAGDVDGSSVRTALTREHLLWRYGFSPLDYRAVQLSNADVAEGLAVFRLRQRGPALEAAVCEILLPAPGMVAGRKRLLTKILQTSGADHAVVLGPRSIRSGTLPLPAQGPTLVWRPLGQRFTEPPARWRLTLGDIELF